MNPKIVPPIGDGLLTFFRQPVSGKGGGVLIEFATLLAST
jgi:hypothetical protein